VSANSRNFVCSYNEEIKLFMRHGKQTGSGFKLGQYYLRPPTIHYHEDQQSAQDDDLESSMDV